MAGVVSDKAANAPGSREKQVIRERVWRLLEQRGAARFPGAQGRIPNFVGAEKAAQQLAELNAWNEARVIKANPDAPQLPVRALALAERKVVFVAVPRLRDQRPFLRLDPRTLPVPPRKAASISGAATYGRPTTIGRMRRIDLVVCGSVAVNPKGQRVGKGGGFSDLEFALLSEAGLIDDRTVIVTTVHDLQVLDRDLPETEHDFRVDVIATPTEVIPAPRRRRPPGIIWAHLGEDKVSEIPVLAALAKRR